MLTIVKGIGLLLLTLACFSVFSLKFPKGSEAMSGMANAAVASFLVEAVHHYITGDLLGIALFCESSRHILWQWLSVTTGCADEFQSPYHTNCALG